MKHFCTILLMAFLIGGTGFPVSSQENPNRLVIEEQDTVIIKLSGNRLIIENLPKDEILEIYNIMGVKVYSRRVKAGTNEYTLSLSKGFYILKIGRITKKIAVTQV
ncbi:T9SS type A sorting domain-containing protein [Proteiniphilum sp. UBA1028]|uniref:T9SS type A sorting domain-containing protein n=1 Tax=Proteiniphilum sp. UBA1028 TaxID=1947251 RepID=UPI000E7DECBD|nr:T9SS type A sorting domain-containing protein [Proteiniphilum sp. UBA1028]HBG58755.1 hypothetical protein [Porphyromonadaceae bacterium]